MTSVRRPYDSGCHNIVNYDYLDVDCWVWIYKYYAQTCSSMDNKLFFFKEIKDGTSTV